MFDIVPSLSREVLDLVMVAGAAAAVLALLLAVIANWRVRRLRRRVTSAPRRVVVPARTTGAVQGAIRQVGLVRYDAFPDSSGMQSFSAALLDDGGNGIVITSINGRHESRTYAKGIEAGEAAQPLSPEEGDAITRALAGDAGVLVGTAPEGAGVERDGQPGRDRPSLR